MQTKEKVEVIRLATGLQKPINEYKRFAILVLGSFGCIVCSFTFAWNLISDTMQRRYMLSQRDLTTIVTTGLVFQFTVLPYAFLYDYFGPTPIAVLATINFPLGTLLLALCFMGQVHGTVVRLAVFNAFVCGGCILFDLCSVVTVLSYFPSNRGPVTALLKTFTGLGSALVAALYAGFFNSDPKQYFFFLFSVGLVVGVLCIVFMRLPPYHLTGYEEKKLPDEVQERRVARKAQYLRQEVPLRRFVWGFVILVVLIVFLPTQSALVSYLRLDMGAKLAFAVVTCILTGLYLIVALPVRFMNSSHIPLFNPVSEKKDCMLTERKARSSGSTSRTEGYAAREDGNGPDAGNHEEELMEMRQKDMISDPEALREALDADRAEADEVATGETELDYLAPQYQGTFLHNLTTLEIWALWWTMFTVLGAELVVIYNARFLLTALQSAPVDESLSTMLTVLNGVGSAVGRLLMSYFEVWSQKRKVEDRIPITVSLFFPTGSVILTLVLFLVLPAAALPLPYVFAAMGNGFLAAVQILVTRTIFAKDPAKHYNFCFTANLFAAILFNRFLYGEWYTVQAEKQGRADMLCYGKGCVMMPLLVMLGLACSAFITDVILHLRYRSYCQRTLAERARLREEAAALAIDSHHGVGDSAVVGEDKRSNEPIGDYPARV